MSPQSVNLFSRKRNKASSRVSPDVSVVPKQQRKRNSVSMKANPAEPAESTTLDEDIRKAAALSAETELLIQQNATKAAETAQMVNKAMNKAMDHAHTINSIISGTQSKVNKSDEDEDDDDEDEDEDDDDALLAKFEQELAEEALTGKKLSKLSRKEEKEYAKLLSSLSQQEQRDLDILTATSKGGRITRKQKKSRTRRRHKKSRKY
jgi:hypothetical protein